MRKVSDDFSLVYSSNSLTCCCSVASSCLTLCDPVNCSMPGFPVLHPIPEFAHTYVLWVGDTIQPLHLLLPRSLPALYICPASGSFPMSQFFASGGQRSFGISPSSAYSGVIFFRIDRFDLLCCPREIKINLSDIYELWIVLIAIWLWDDEGMK